MITSREDNDAIDRCRTICTDRPHAHGWRHFLVWGDNLLALRELLADQQGQNRLGTRGKIKLIDIGPPFATRHAVAQFPAAGRVELV
jgi:hypothetical protein